VAKAAVRKYARDLRLNRGSAKVEEQLCGLEVLYTIFFGAVLFGMDARSLDRYIRKLAGRLVSKPEFEQQMSDYLKELFEDLLPWLSIHASTNELIRAVRMANSYDQPSLITAVDDAKRMFVWLHNALMDVPDSDPGQMSKTKRYDIERQISPTPAIMTAICLAVAKKDNLKRFLARLRNGDLPNLREEVGKYYTGAAKEFFAMQSGVV
jgi:hypothetical protein